MKNITLSADEHLIELAREEARRRKTSLNALFRDWLADLARQEEQQQKIVSLFEKMDHYQAGGPFTRDEMNDR